MATIAIGTYDFPPADRVEMGRAIGGLVLQRVTDDRRPRWIFSCTPNTSRIRPGEEVVLTLQTPVEGEDDEGGVFKVEDDLDPERLVLVAADPREVPAPADLEGRTWIADPRGLDLWDHVAAAVERARAMLGRAPGAP